MTPINKSKICEESTPHLLLIFSQLIFSFWHIIGYLAQKRASLFVFSLYRTGFASTLMLFFILIRSEGYGKIFRINRDDYLRFMYIAFCNVINILGTLIAFSYVAPNQYAIMQPLVPILATLLSCVIRLEKLTFLKVTGVTVAVLGSIMIGSGTSTEKANNVKDMAENSRLGTFIVFLQCFFSANLIVFQKKLLELYDSDVVTFVYYCLTTIYIAVICVILYDSLSIGDFTFHNEKFPWFAVAYSTVFVSLIAGYISSWSGKRLVPSISSVYMTLQPVGTFLLSWIFFNYIPTSNEVLGGIVVLIGLIITLYGKCEEEGQGYSSTSIYTEAIVRTNIVATVPTIQAIDIEYQELINDKGEEISYCQEESQSERFSLSPPVAHLVRNDSY